MLKQEILKKLGKDHTTPCVFDKDWNFVEAIYTYKNDVYCLFNGEDFPFDDLSNNQKIRIVREIVENRYVLNKSKQ